MIISAIQSKIAVNLVTGTLGSGKTTLLLNLLKHKPASENWGILVNDFGAIGIDGAILETDNDSVQVSQIPGGCICCSALTDFKTTILELTKKQHLDRIIIEPSGLGEPDSIIDILHSAEFKSIFEVQTVFAVLDSSTAKVEQFDQLMIMRNLIEVADIIIFNKQDMASRENTTALNQYSKLLYPPKLAVINTTQSIIDPKLISLESLSQKKNHTSPFTMHQQERSKTQLTGFETDDNQQDPIFDDFQPPVSLKGLKYRKSKKQLKTVSIGWAFNNDVIFDWQKLVSLFEELNQTPISNSSPLRAKGVFKIGEPRMLFQWVKQKPVTRDYIAYKRDSRLEVLLPQSNNFDACGFESKLSKCQK